MAGWKQGELGRYAGRIQASPTSDVAVQVLRDLVRWSQEPPAFARDHFGGATWGLEGIDTYARDCADMDASPAWVACHPITPQWTARRCTGVYLDRLVDQRVFDDDVNTRLSAAAVHDRAAFSCWAAFYDLLGHETPEEVQGFAARRKAAAAVVEAWLAHEKAALSEVRVALDTA